MKHLRRLSLNIGLTVKVYNGSKLQIRFNASEMLAEF